MMGQARRQTEDHPGVGVEDVTKCPSIEPKTMS
jgi:hypothetical protein